ncbi:uncharacterized protein CBL_12072 [Carabus blaptoides fortunei]
MKSSVTVSVVTIVLVLSAIVDAGKLPAYIQPCSRSDPNIGECAKRNGQLALPTLVKGDKTYKIPSLSPLKIPLISFEASDSLKINIRDCEITGLEDTVIQSANMDINNRRFTFVVHIPRANLIGEYDINGRILILPIQGKGPANITFVDGTYTYDVDYKIIEKKGVKYIEIDKSSIAYETKRSYYHLDNLFNGDGVLGEQMNKFLDENWREVSKDIGPALSETISQIITTILSSILARVPYDEFLIE